MDNEELRKALHTYTGDFVPVLREELARLIVDSDELAALRARIEAAPVGEVGIDEWNLPHIQLDEGSFVRGQRVRLLPEPAKGAES